MKRLFRRCLKNSAKPSKDTSDNADDLIDYEENARYSEETTKE